MIRLISLVIILGLFSGFKDTNLIKNGDFENGEDGWQSGRFYMDKNGCACDLDYEFVIATATKHCIDSGFKFGMKCKFGKENRISMENAILLDKK